MRRGIFKSSPIFRCFRLRYFLRGDILNDGGDCCRKRREFARRYLWHRLYVRTSYCDNLHKLYKPRLAGLVARRGVAYNARRAGRAAFVCGNNIDDYLRRHDCIEPAQRPLDKKAGYGACDRGERGDDCRGAVLLFRRRQILDARCIRGAVRLGRGRSGRVAE